MDSKTPRASHPRASRRRYAPWLLLAAGLLCIPGLAYWIVAEDAAVELPYGQFKKRLARREIASVKVGPTELTGTFNAAGAGPKVRPVHFHTSRLGMEHDDGL